MSATGDRCREIGDAVDRFNSFLAQQAAKTAGLPPNT
jgi:hypothetical protein